ncbi:MAG: hypothetical protein Q8Q95_03255 [bacterium]|nr:hypothetical protein [bacterium]
MPTTLEEKKNILNFVHNLSDTVRDQKWISNYDAENDSFAMRVPDLSKNSHKKYFNDEFAFYLNKKNEVEGIFIEYFMSNFVTHHRDFKAITKNFKPKKRKSILELKKSEVNKIAPELESIIINSLILNSNLQKSRL